MRGIGSSESREERIQRIQDKTLAMVNIRDRDIKKLNWRGARPQKNSLKWVWKAAKSRPIYPQGLKELGAGAKLFRIAFAPLWRAHLAQTLAA